MCLIAAPVIFQLKPYYNQAIYKHIRLAKKKQKKIQKIIGQPFNRAAIINFIFNISNFKWCADWTGLFRYGYNMLLAVTYWNIQYNIPYCGYWVYSEADSHIPEWEAKTQQPKQVNSSNLH